MVKRDLELSSSSSFFLFGARGTGKSTLIQKLYPHSSVLWIDLLQEDQYELYRKRPQRLSEQLVKSPSKWVVIDEVQKLPVLLDIVHSCIQKKLSRFALTGSSARKLKRMGANLLAGRAFTYNLYPFTSTELSRLNPHIELQHSLEWGSLPGLFEFSAVSDKHEFLRSYVRNYLHQEIIAEQVIRKIDPFRDFLQIAAQSNGEPINCSRISQDAGTDHKTIESYFQILEDTLVGYRLPAYHRSIRKRQAGSPKFYFFDTGVKRALDMTLMSALNPGSSEYGRALEHWLVIEAIRKLEYSRADYRLSHLRTKDGAEIDLVIERSGKKTLLVEIKSTDTVTERDTRVLEQFIPDWGKPVEAQVWSRDSIARRLKNVEILPFTEAIRNL
ncbi:MAG: hypothetical protein A2583_15730 [Bdellovibrionales bacterium RIFOXYD1_FULL_53_11]|nr:MAG: hypothetical protein A2583_15730 [Bdellovibrionales bacterium RIFOXYD1_FULL_53_11]